jgi:hypothetical protein
MVMSFGKSTQHRTRSAGAGDDRSLFDGFGQFGDVLDQEIVLDAGSGDADRVHFLKASLPISAVGT